MLIGDEFKEIVEKRYAEAIAQKVDSIVLDEKQLGGIKIFIKEAPKFCMSTFVMEDGTEVFVGANSITETVS